MRYTGVGTQIGKAINDAIPDDVSDQIIDGIVGLFGGKTNADRVKKQKELEEKQAKEWEERKKMREAEKKRLEEEQKRVDEQKKADEEKKKSEDKIAAEEEQKRKEEWAILKEGQMTASSANTAGAISDTAGVNVANTADVGRLEKPTPVTAGTAPNIVEATTKADTSVVINQPKDKPVPVVMTDEKGAPLINSVDRKEQANRLGGSTAAPGAPVEPGAPPAGAGAGSTAPPAGAGAEGATRVPVEPGKMDHTQSTSIRTLSGDLEEFGLTPERISAMAKEMGFDISPEEAKNAPDKVLAKLGGGISSLMHQSEAKGTPGGVPRTAYNPDRRSPVGRSGAETNRTNTQFGGQPSAIEQARTQAATQDQIAQSQQKKVISESSYSAQLTGDQLRAAETSYEAVKPKPKLEDFQGEGVHPMLAQGKYIAAMLKWRDEAIRNSLATPVAAGATATGTQPQPSATPGQVAQGVAAGVPAILAAQGVPGAAAVSGAVTKAPKIAASTAERFEQVKGNLQAAAKSTGVDVGTLAKITNIESKFDTTAQPISKGNPGANKYTPNGVAGAKAGISSAYGLGQFLNSTWEEQMMTHGSKYGVKGSGPGGKITKEDANKYRGDTQMQANILAEYSKQGIDLGEKYGLKDQDAAVYAHHNLGAGGAKRLFEAVAKNPNAPITSVLTAEEIKNNPSLYKPGMTAAEAFNNLGTKMRAGESLAQKAATAPGQPAPTPTSNQPTSFTADNLKFKNKKEAMGGGANEQGILALANNIQSSVSGMKYITAMNDEYHQSATYKNKKIAAGGTGKSAHQEGTAMDFTINDPKQSAAAAKQVEDMLKAAGVEGKVIDEYKTKTAAGTGGHIHVNFKDKKEADKYAAFMSGKQPPGQPSTEQPGTVNPAEAPPVAPQIAQQAQMAGAAPGAPTPSPAGAISNTQKRRHIV